MFEIIYHKHTNRVITIQAYLVLQIEHNQPAIECGMWETRSVDKWTVVHSAGDSLMQNSTVPEIWQIFGLNNTLMYTRIRD